MTTTDISQRMALVVDKSAISDLLIAVGRAQDTRDWVAYAGCFADRVLVEQPMDPTWVPQEVTAHEWAERAASTLNGFDLTHHCLFNLQVEIEGDTAAAGVDLIARHEFDRGAETDVYTLGGRYHIALRRQEEGWRISSRRLEVRWEDGDSALMHAARERVSAREAGFVASYR